MQISRICYLLVHATDASNSNGWTSTKAGAELNLSLSHGRQEPKHTDHHLLPPRMRISRKLEVEEALGL